MATALNISDRLRETPDEEIARLYAAMRLVKDTARWEEIVATFPPIPDTFDDWRAAWNDFDYEPIIQWRKATIAIVEKERLDPAAILAWYAQGRVVEFINHWGVTYDPRAQKRIGTTHPPFILFPRQRELVAFLLLCLEGEEHGLIEKSRDMGATWIACFFSLWLWLTTSASVGWGSRKEELVDRIGDPDSIFEKLRMGLRHLPRFLWPRGLSEADHLVFMKCINPATGATITGEIGDNIGRGGRSLIYFKDESAHYARPDLIEASLGDNTNVQIDISSVNGLGNVFERRRHAGVDWLPGQPVVKGYANVFVMDWSEHPGKTQAWFDERREKAIREGLLAKFEQEVCRNYAASVEGIIIKPEWVRAAIDAHIKLNLDVSGGWSGGLDVADGEGGDTNAAAGFEGIVLRRAKGWGDRDIGVTTRTAIGLFEDIDIDLQYDSVGVGAAVKAEANRLAETIGEDGLPLLPENIRLIPWSAGAGVVDPDEPVNPDDRDSSTNKNMFANLKAQAWWKVARRFEKTYRAVAEGIEYDSSELISIDSTIPILRQIESELSQPTIKKRPSDMKLLVDKTPEGTKSPNVGDAIIMAAFPLTGQRPVFATAIPEFRVPPMELPSQWPRAFAMKVEPERTCVLWAAYDKLSDVLWITTEHVRSRVDPAVNIAAIKARGAWIPGIVASDNTNLEARRELAAFYANEKLDIILADRSFDAGVQDANQRISTARLKAFATCQGFFTAYRAYRRDEEGEVIGGGLMDCLRLLCRPHTISIMKVKPKFDAWGRAVVPGMPREGHGGDPKMGY